MKYCSTKKSVAMDINIKAIKFDATDKLQDFIQKKISKLDKYCNDIRKVEVSLKVVKPETAMNKQASLTVVLPKTELFAEKICDTFEEAVMETLDAIEKQLARYKEKQTNI